MFPWSLELGIWNLPPRLAPRPPIQARRKHLLLPRRYLSFAPYAKAHRAQQNSQVGRETFQDHRDRKNLARTCVATSFDVVEKREAQTAVEQGRPRRQDRYGADQGKPAVRLNRIRLTTHVSLFRCAIRSVKRPSQLELDLEPRLSQPERN